MQPREKWKGWDNKVETTKERRQWKQSDSETESTTKGIEERKEEDDVRIETIKQKKQWKRRKKL